ncbi:MAG: hypothetical protein QNJ81_07390 [Acidimicrobiia bacterium]|nr:hypothetical protein [Acidimicrobiia bacterium]
MKKYRDGWQELRLAGTVEVWISHSPSPAVPRIAIIVFLLLNPGGQLWILAALGFALAVALAWLVVARQRIASRTPDTRPDVASALISTLWMFGGPSPRDSTPERLLSVAVAIAAVIGLVRVLWVVGSGLLDDV